MYLNSERGRAALAEDRHGFCKALWNDFSPRWPSGDDVYERMAASLDNPDFVAVVLHSYRVRIGAVAGDPALEQIEQRLAKRPKITVPTIALAGADDGVDPPAACDQFKPYFTDLRRYATLPGVGHNLQQEAPTVVAEAVLELSD